MKDLGRTLALLTVALGSALSSLAQSVTSKGSDSLVGLGQKWAAAYGPRHPEVKLQVEGGGAVAAFAALREQKANLATVSRLMRYQEAEACESALGRRPAEYKVGVNGLAVYVNANNPVKVLTYDELGGIFRGKYGNWKELDGLDAPISLYGQPTNSAAGELFGEEILNGKACAAGLRTLGAAELLKAIATDRNAIGYGPLLPAQGVRALAVKRAFSSTPVEPTEETIANRLYPIARYLYIYVNPAAYQGALKAYVDWIRSDEGQQIVKAAGFYPLPAKFRSSP